MILPFNPLFPFILLVGVAGFVQKPNDKPATRSPEKTFNWKARHVALESTWSSPWKRLVASNSKDDRDEVLQLFSHPTSESFCVIRVTRDVSLEVLSNRDLLDAMKGQILPLHEENKLVDEVVTKRWGKSFTRLRFDTHTKKKPTQIWQYVRRDGTWCWSIQYIFPASKSPQKLPKPFSQLEFKLELADSKPEK